jgi:PAS domain S-box-containing protein
MATVDPPSFVAALIRNGRVRATVERFADDLARSEGAWTLRRSLCRALGDNALELGFWIPHLEAYVDSEGRPVDLTPVRRQERTVVADAGTPVAALLHAPADAELVQAVCAIAAPSLERERGEHVARLRGSETAALVNALPDLMLRIRRDGTYVDFAGDVRLLAVPPDTIVGTKVQDALPPVAAEAILTRVRHVLDSGGVEVTEYPLRTLDGVLRDFEARVVQSGEDEALLIVRDITERKQAERELTRLQDELRASLEDLRESRARIVEAGDTERRRLERNLHDGAQQRLVAVSQLLQLALRRITSDPPGVEELIGSATEELTEAHEELRELARGIHPASLSVGGLGSALSGLASRSTVPVIVKAVPSERLPESVEVAAYYVVSEAVTNAAKYAQASAVTISVRAENGSAVIEVVDDGVGGATAGGGSGLLGLSDRVEALSGRLEVESPRGEGTRVRAVIPV